MPSTPSPCTLNSPPPSPPSKGSVTIHHLRRGGRRIWGYHVDFRGEGEAGYVVADRV